MDTIQFNICPQAEDAPAPPYTWRWRKVHNGKPFWYYSHSPNVSGESERIEYRETANDVWREVNVGTSVGVESGNSTLPPALKEKLADMNKATRDLIKTTFNKIKTHRKGRGIGRTRKASSKRNKK